MVFQQDFQYTYPVWGLEEIPMVGKSSLMGSEIALSRPYSIPREFNEEGE